jgi:hypothetical protein
MFSEASTILRAVAGDFFFNCWRLEIPSDNRSLKYKSHFVSYVRNLKVLNSQWVLIAVQYNFAVMHCFYF